MSTFSLIIPILALFLSTHTILGQTLCDHKERDVLLRIKTHFKNPSSLSSWKLMNYTTSDCSLWDGITIDDDKGHVIALRITLANDIVGPIPTFVDELPFLETLAFNGVPNLSGPIPSSIGNLKNLTSLTIWETKVAGAIPPSFSQLTQLTYLNLNSNQLSGPIPDFIGRKLTKLDYIGLESNQLSGPIPASFSLLPFLTTVHLSKNQLTGPIPNPMGKVDVVGSMDLSHNVITGDASFLFDKKYTRLSLLYVNNNMLKFDFSNVDLAPNLVVFNLSHNMIYGSLSRGFGQMKAADIDHVDVSFNELCGPIPNGRRFKKADPAIFAHNKCLCGGPLAACEQ